MHDIITIHYIVDTMMTQTNVLRRIRQHNIPEYKNQYSSTRRAQVDTCDNIDKQKRVGAQYRSSASAITHRRAYEATFMPKQIVNNSKDQPVIILSSGSVYEHLPRDSIIGRISMLHVDNNDFFYQTNSAGVYIQGNILYTNQEFDYSTLKCFDVTIKANRCTKICSNIVGTFKIHIIDAYTIQTVIAACISGYTPDSDLLDYIDDDIVKNSVKQINHINWYKVKNGNKVKKNYVLDRSAILSYEYNTQIQISLNYATETIFENEYIQFLNVEPLTDFIDVSGEGVERNALSAIFNHNQTSMPVEMLTNKYSNVSEYKWFRSYSNTTEPIANTNKPSYTLSQIDVDWSIYSVYYFRDINTIVRPAISNTVGPVLNIDNLPTGNLVINSGVLEPGYTLEATSNIYDVDGIDPNNLTLSWFRNYKSYGNIQPIQITWQMRGDTTQPWNPIQNSNNNTFYIPNDASANTQYRAVVESYDASGNVVTTTSDSTEPLDTTTPNPYNIQLNGTPQIGETIHLTYDSSLAYQFGAGDPADVDTSVTYLWTRSSNKVSWSSIPNSNSELFTIPDYPGTIYTGLYLQALLFVMMDGVLQTFYSPISTQIQNYPLYTTVRQNASIIMTGRALEGETIVVYPNNVNVITSYSYDWQVSLDRNVWVSITGSRTSNITAVSGTYPVTQSSFLIPNDETFVGLYLRAVLCLITNNGDKNIKTLLISNISNRIVNLDNAASGTLQISGTPIGGKSLETSFQNLSDNDGNIIHIQYLWQFSKNSLWETLPREKTQSIYLPINNKYSGMTIRSLAVTTDTQGGTTTFTSEPVGPIQNYTETNTSVIIEGEAFEGSTLNLSTDSVGNLETNFKKFTIFWNWSIDKNVWINSYRENSPTFTIPGNSSYVSKFIQVEINATDFNDIEHTLVSNITSPVQPNYNYENDVITNISGSNKPGEPLILAIFSSITTDDLVLDPSGNPHRENIYNIQDTDVNTRFRATISYTDKRGNQTEVISVWDTDELYTPYISSSKTADIIGDALPQTEYIVSTNISGAELMDLLTKYTTVNITSGTIVSAFENFIISENQILTVDDGGLLNIYKVQISLADQSQLNVYGTVAITNSRTPLGDPSYNIIIQDDASYQIFNNGKIEFENINDVNECTIDYIIRPDDFLILLEQCGDSLIRFTNGGTLKAIKEPIVIPSGTHILIDKTGSIEATNSIITLESSSSLELRGSFLAYGHLDIKTNANFYIDYNASFAFQDDIGEDNLPCYVHEDNTITSNMNEFLNKCYQLRISNSATIRVTDNFTLTNRVLVIDYCARVVFEKDVHIGVGATLIIYGIVNFTGDQFKFTQSDSASIIQYPTSTVVNISLPRQAQCYVKFTRSYVINNPTIIANALIEIMPNVTLIFLNGLTLANDSKLWVKGNLIIQDAFTEDGGIIETESTGNVTIESNSSSADYYESTYNAIPYQTIQATPEFQNTLYISYYVLISNSYLFTSKIYLDVNTYELIQGATLVFSKGVSIRMNSEIVLNGTIVSITDTIEDGGTLSISATGSVETKTPEEISALYSNLPQYSDISQIPEYIQYVGT